jgi:hypothetical protein
VNFGPLQAFCLRVKRMAREAPLYGNEVTFRDPNLLINGGDLVVFASLRTHASVFFHTNIKEPQKFIVVSAAP